MARFYHPPVGDASGLTTTINEYTPVWAGTGLTFTGTPTTGYYIKIGNLVQVQIGKIQQLQSQVAELTLTPDGVSALMSAVSDTFTNISVLQANIQPPVSEY